MAASDDETIFIDIILEYSPRSSGPSAELNLWFCYMLGKFAEVWIEITRLHVTGPCGKVNKTNTIRLGIDVDA